MAAKDNPLRQRLVGAVVLVALAVIFIPMFLGGGREEEGARPVPPEPPELAAGEPLELEHVVEAPPPPEVVRVPVDEDTPAAALPPEDAAAKAPIPPPAKPAPAPPGARAFAVQVGSFRERRRALALRDRLRKAGYAAFVEAVTARGRTVYRVRVGPEVKKSAARALRKQLLDKGLVKEAWVVAHP